MNKKVSIIIPSYKRTHLLKWNLLSLSKQNILFEFETIVLNDGIRDETEALCLQYKDKLNIKYFFTGQRNTNKLVWRVPGFAINIGVKKSDGDIIILCCAEMFHINNTVELITDFSRGEKSLTIPKAKDDNGKFLKHVEIYNGNINVEEYNKQPQLENVKFPFFIAMKRKEFIDIGGYDEDFTGTDYDDQDFIERLLDSGCEHTETEAVVIHLWHPRLAMTQERIPRFEYNKKLYEDRKGIIVRNKNKDWGIL